MVYPNYDPSYVEPLCDLCGTRIGTGNPLRITLRVTTQAKHSTEIEKKSHLCEECNEAESALSGLHTVDAHFSEPILSHQDSEFLMIELKAHSGEWKYSPETAPEFISNIVTAIASHNVSGFDVADGTMAAEYAAEIEEKIHEQLREGTL